VLSINDLDAGYGGSTVLHGVGMRVEPGQVVCLMGRNGVGKTTLLKSVIGLLRPQKGKLLFNEQDLTRAAPDRRAKAGIGYVPQGREIFPQLTVEENLLLGLEALKGRDKGRSQSGAGGATPGERRRERIPDVVFEMFPALAKMLQRKGGQLSGGQQQQLAIGRALISQPSLLLLDEPMEGIQPSVVSEIEQVIETLKEKRETSILLVEQSLAFATRIADYYYILDKGSIVAEGNSDELSDEVVRKHLTV